MRKTVVVPSLAATLACSAVYAAPKVTLLPLLGKDFDAYERVLGTPKRTVKEDKTDEGARLLSETRYYTVAGLVRIVLTKGNDGSKEHPPTMLRDHVSSISVQFTQGAVTSWKAALEKVGLPAATVTAKPGDGHTDLAGLPAGWSGAWIPNNPDTGNDELQLWQ